jgi:dCMP deaminase
VSGPPRISKAAAPKTPQWVWDQRFMRLAREVASWSRDPNEGVGAYIVSPDKRSHVAGYNGVVADHFEELVILRHKFMKDKLCRHAEVNAIANARRDLTGWTMYCTKAPCTACAHDLYAHGIKRLVCEPIREDSRWADEQFVAINELRMLGVKVEHPRDS